MVELHVRINTTHSKKCVTAYPFSQFLTCSFFEDYLKNFVQKKMQKSLEICYNWLMSKRIVELKVYFYATELGNEPVKKWMKDLSLKDKQIIAEDIKTVQYGYPIGMPLT